MTEPQMGKLMSREYLSRHGVGNSAECELLKQSISQQLYTWYSEKKITGHCVVTLSSESDIINEDLVDFEIPKLTDGRFPVVWVNVTFRPPQFSQPDRDEFEATHDLQLICETESLD